MCVHTSIIYRVDYFDYGGKEGVVFVAISSIGGDMRTLLPDLTDKLAACLGISKDVILVTFTVFVCVCVCIVPDLRRRSLDFYSVIHFCVNI